MGCGRRGGETRVSENTFQVSVRFHIRLTFLTVNRAGRAVLARGVLL